MWEMRTKGKAILIGLEHADEALNQGSQEEEECRLWENSRGGMKGIQGPNTMEWWKSGMASQKPKETSDPH